MRKSLFAQRQFDAQQEAKNQLVDKLVDMHDFPVPETFVDQQIKSRTGRALAEMAEAHGLVVELAVGSGYYPFGAHVSRLMARLDGRHAAYLVQRYRRA